MEKINLKTRVLAPLRCEDSIVDNLLTFLFAGQDSTAAAMASCLCFLCSNPGCKDTERLLGISFFLGVKIWVVHAIVAI